MNSHNGWRSWNAWNVNLWLTSDEHLYDWAFNLVQKHGALKASYKVLEVLKGKRTPDGAKYTQRSIYETLRVI